MCEGQQRLYQDNSLPFKLTETGKGEVRPPVYQSLYSFARLVHPVADWLSGFQ